MKLFPKVLSYAVAALAVVVVAATPANAATMERTGSGDYRQTAVDQLLSEHLGGTQIGPQEVAYEGGHVIMNVGPASLSDCPGGLFEVDWVCLYDGTSHTGRMLKFNDPGYVQSLDAYGFNNATSSWANTRGSSAYLYDFVNGTGGRICLQANSNATSMGAYNNWAGSIQVNSFSSC